MKLIFTTAMLLWGSIIYAQNTNESVKGRIIDANLNSISDVLIKVKGTDKTSYTNNNGEFTFDLPEGKYELEIYYKTKKINTKIIDVKNDSYANLTINIENDEKTTTIKEVQIKGNKNKGYSSTKASQSLRTSEPLIDIAQNIQIINKDVLNDQLAFSVFDGVFRNVSGTIRTSHQGLISNVYIRGYSTGSGSFRNGMKVSGSFSPMREDMSFVESIDVVKGPATFMLGNTPPGGFYNVVTKIPQGNNKKSASFSLGSFKNYRGEIDLDGRFTKNNKLLYRLNLMAQDSKSFLDYQFNKGYVIAPSLKYNIDDDTDFTLEYILNTAKVNNLADYAYSDKGFKESPVNTSYSDPKKNPIQNTEHSVFATLNHKMSDSWSFTGKLGYLNYKMIGEQLGLAYNKTDFVTGNTKRQFSYTDNQNIYTMGQFFVKGLFKTGKVKHDIIGGVDFGNVSSYAVWSNVGNLIDFNIYNPTPLRDEDLPKTDRSLSLKKRAELANRIQTNRYKAVFLQDELSLFDNKLRIGLGIRYTNSYRKGNPENNVYTPRFSASYTYCKNAVLYAVYDNTFEENYSILENYKPAKPSYGRNIELGFKNIWLNGKLYSTISIYRINKSNITSNSPTQGYVKQIGNSKSVGVELDIQGELLPRLNATINYAYNDGKLYEALDKNSDALTSSILPGSARHITNAWLNYRIENKTILSGLGFSVGYQLQTHRSSWNGSRGYILPNSFFSLDGGISYKKVKYSVEMIVNNITNNFNYQGFNKGGSWGYNHFGWVASEPRSYRVRVTYNF